MYYFASGRRGRRRPSANAAAASAKDQAATVSWLPLSRQPQPPGAAFRPRPVVESLPPPVSFPAPVVPPIEVEPPIVPTTMPPPMPAVDVLPAEPGMGSGQTPFEHLSPPG